MNNVYVCDCGKSFSSANSLYGHKSNCEIYNLIKYGSLEKLENRKKRCISARANGYTKYAERLKQEKCDRLTKWLQEKHLCEKCGKVMTEYFGSGRFCSRSCANSRIQTSEDRLKKRLSAILNYKKDNKRCNKKDSKKIEADKISKYEQNPKICKCCGKRISYNDRHRTTCSKECEYKLKADGGHKGGRQSVNLQGRRSKNEIAFCELCEKYFGKENVIHNVPMFNGWDADIIIPHLKIAILWNGPWHYKQVTKTHKLKQVQNRDRIKLNEIVKCGFEPYIIKDMGKGKKSKVVDEFEKLKQYLSTRF